MRAVIAGTGHAVPDRVITNADVEARVEATTGFAMPAGLIELLTGVRERRYAADDAVSSDLAAQAGLAALDDAGVHPMAVDVLICASATHDVSEPATAAVVQDKTGCRNASIMDVSNACAGFLSGLDAATALIETGRAERVLITAGEVVSAVTDWSIAGMADLGTKFAGLTLGDAGGAFLLQASADPGRGVLQGSFMADGSQWRLSTVLAGGTLMRQRVEGAYFSCRSNELAALALEHLPPLIDKTLERVGWAPTDLALVVPHQVTRGIVTQLCERGGVPMERCAVTLDRYGNNAAASIPFATSLAVAEGRLQRGDKVLLVVGAAGFSAGVVPVVW